MESSVSPKDEIWFLRVCHHISTGLYLLCLYRTVDSSWNVMTHGDAREGKWTGNLWMEWVASTLHTTSEHGLSSITTADVYTSAASSRLNWRPLADLIGLVLAERRNLVSARVPSHFNWLLQIHSTLKQALDSGETSKLCSIIHIYIYIHNHKFY